MAVVAIGIPKLNTLERHPPALARGEVVTREELSAAENSIATGKGALA